MIFFRKFAELWNHYHNPKKIPLNSLQSFTWLQSLIMGFYASVSWSPLFGTPGSDPLGQPDSRPTVLTGEPGDSQVQRHLRTDAVNLGFALFFREPLSQSTDSKMEFARWPVGEMEEKMRASVHSAFASLNLKQNLNLKYR